MDDRKRQGWLGCVKRRSVYDQTTKQRAWPLFLSSFFTDFAGSYHISPPFGHLPYGEKERASEFWWGEIEGGTPFLQSSLQPPIIDWFARDNTGNVLTEEKEAGEFFFVDEIPCCPNWMDSFGSNCFFFSFLKWTNYKKGPEESDWDTSRGKEVSWKRPQQPEKEIWKKIWLFALIATKKKFVRNQRFSLCVFSFIFPALPSVELIPSYFIPCSTSDTSSHLHLFSCPCDIGDLSKNKK